MHGSDRVPDLNTDYERAWGWQSNGNGNSFNESEMALFYECMRCVLKKLLDTADIVRDAVLYRRSAETSVRCRNSVTSEAAYAPKSSERLEELNGHHRADHCHMRSGSDNDGWNRFEQLLTELRAIERWDADYWRKNNLEAYEMLGFLGRRNRRAEILSQLLIIIPALVIKEQEQWAVNKFRQRTEARANASNDSSGKPKKPPNTKKGAIRGNQVVQFP
jgi:hypothetical protein